MACKECQSAGRDYTERGQGEEGEEKEYVTRGTLWSYDPVMAPLRVHVVARCS